MSSSVIGALRVNLGIDTAAFSKGLKGANTSLNRTARLMQGAFVAAAASAAAAVAGIGVAVRRSINEADRIAKTADKIGVGVEALQELRYAADLSGVSANTLDMALQRFSRRTAEAAKGSGVLAKEIKAQGIALRDSDGRTRKTVDVLADYIDAIGSAGSEQERLRLAFAAFDSEGAALVNMAKNGAAGLREMMSEARSLGFVISEETARKAEAFNDNLTRIGRAGQGVANTLAAVMLPAMIAVSDAAVDVARGLASLVSALPTVAEYAAVAAGSLALLAAPSILAGVASLAVAIGSKLVGSLLTLEAVIMANPLGALAVAIAAAVTAVYHFRDEIRQAIGVDVVQVAKRAGNLLIGSFVGAYKQIEFVWNNFAGVMGAAVVGAVNASIRAINGLIQGAANGVDWLIEKINQIPGVEIGLIGDVSAIGEIQNTYAEKLKGAADKLSADLSAAVNRDYIGELGEAFSASLGGGLGDFGDLGGGLAKGIGDINTALGGTGGAAAKAKGALSELAAEGKRVFEATRTPLENYNAEIERLGVLLRAGAIDQDTYNRAAAQAKETLDGAADSASGFASAAKTIGSQFSEAFKGVIDGTKTVGEALSELANKAASMLIDGGFQALANAFGNIGKASAPSSSSSGGWLSGIFGGIKSLFGFANGGTMRFGGGDNKMDGQLAAFRVSAGETVKVSRGEDRGVASVASISVNVDGANGDDHVVALVRQGVSAGLGEYDKELRGRRLLGRMNDAQLRYGR